MRVFTPDEIRAFLSAVDDALPTPGELVIVGGAAAVLR